MGKKPDKRLTDTLDEIKSVNEDIYQFIWYCLYSADKVDSVWGSNYFQTRHDKTGEVQKLATSLSLDGYAILHATKELRRLRRSFMLLRYVANDMKIDDTAKATVGKSVKELEQSLESYWRGCVQNEAALFIGRFCDRNTATLFSSGLKSLDEKKSQVVMGAVSSGLYGGHDSKAKFIADGRAALLILECLLQPSSKTFVSKDIESRKEEIAKYTTDELKRKVQKAGAKLRDQDPTNIEMQGFLLKFVNAPLKFMASASVHPCDGVVPTATDWTLTDMNQLNLPLTRRMGFIMCPGNEQGALQVTDIDSKTRGKEIYFLPWASKRITKLTIPEDTGPGIFFTAAINGCSVFVTGGAKSPTIYHAGLDGALDAEYKVTNPSDRYQAAQKKNAALFWRLLLKDLAKIDDDDILGEVNKNHYILRTVKPIPTSAISEKIRGKKVQTTTHARQFELTLLDQEGVKPQYCTPWGCVFGLRDKNGEWSFYLQENVTIVYNDNKDISWGTCRPIYISRVFFPKTMIEKDSRSDYANVSPSNHEKVWDGTKVSIPNPFDTQNPLILKRKAPVASSDETILDLT